LKPTSKRPDPAFDAALALHRAGKLEQAAQAYRRILKLRPGHSGALNNLGIACRKLGLFDEARLCLERASVNDPQALSNLASLENNLGRFREAAVAAQRATELMPTLAAAHDNLGFALFRLNAIGQAHQALSQAVALDPRSANAWNNFGQVLQRQSRLGDAAQAYRKALELDSSYDLAASNLLFCMHFDDVWTPEQIFEAHVQLGTRFERSVAGQGVKYLRMAVPHGQRPRVAFISADLCNHPVSMFLRPLIAHWPHHKMELGFYSSVKRPDESTSWFEERADFWCDILSMTDEKAAQRIAQDGVDVLIDLSGHTGDSRIKVLAYRPAARQMGWLGYFDTTGMQSVQYLLADAVCVTPQMEHLFTEKVLRMPDDFACFEPPAQAPAVSALPALSNGFVTFGSQNQLAKVTNAVLDLWAQVLAQEPTSRLLFQAQAFNDDAVLQRYRAQFVERGVDLSRIDFLPGASRMQILQNYGRVDIALDPFPCAGGTTTCESLWMGVPVVTLLGDRFGGRHSASHLSAVGLQGMVAQGARQYLEIVRTLCADMQALSQLRSGLRDQMLRSALCDGPRFAYNFEKIISSIIASQAGT